MIEDFEVKSVIDETLEEQTIDRGINPNAKYAGWFNLDNNHSGKCGEKLLKRIFQNIPANIEGDENQVIHNFYDIKAWLNDCTEKTYEVKTARLDNQKHFQFDSITPLNEFDFIILLAVTPDKLYVTVRPRSFIEEKIDDSCGPYSGKMRWCMYGKYLTPMHSGTLDGGLKLTLPSKTLSKYGFIEISNDEEVDKVLIDTLK